MTTPLQDFMVRMRKIDNSHLTVRDIIILWAISREPGMMGKEMADKLGYGSRSCVQIGIARLIKKGLIDDRRPVIPDRKIPNDLHITEKGEKFLMGLVPA